MGTTYKLTDHRSLSRLALTLLATLSLLATQLVGFSWAEGAEGDEELEAAAEGTEPAPVDCLVEPTHEDCVEPEPGGGEPEAVDCTETPDDPSCAPEEPTEPDCETDPGAVGCEAPTTGEDLLSTLEISPTSSHPVINGFEIDGNLEAEGALDWDNVDLTPIPNDNLVFGGGGNARETNRAGWTFQDGQATPPGARLLRGYLHADIDAAASPPKAILRVAAVRATGEGSYWASFEFNQEPQGEMVSGTTVPKEPQEGDLLVSFEYGGTGTGGPEVVVEEWDGQAWAEPGISGDGASNLIEIPSLANLEDVNNSEMLDERTFLEVSVDVSSLLFGDEGECTSFGQAWVRSNTAHGDNGQLKDVLSPVEFDFDSCAAATIKKTDKGRADPQPQSGVDFDLYAGDAEADSDVLDADPIGSCTTRDDGTCPTFTGLTPGDYTAYEVAPPIGFKLSEPRFESFYLDHSQNDAVATFENPPITYQIDVEEEGTNAVGKEHEFTVELMTDYIYNYGFDPETEDEFQSSTTANIDLPGQTIDLEWSGGPSGSGIVEVDGVPLADPSTTATCTTDENGTCSVVVNSGIAGGPGSLTATYNTPFTGDPAASGDSAHTTDGGYFSEISDADEKTWISLDATIDPDGENLIGEDHEFTATVHQSDGSDNFVGDVVVEVSWGGPIDSSITGDGSGQTVSDDDTPVTATCTTEDDDTLEGFGECTFSVSSSGAGAGTVTIVKLTGSIGGEELVVTGATERPDGLGDAAWTAFSNETEDRAATKQWIRFGSTVTPDEATNFVDWDHEFTIAVFAILSEDTDDDGYLDTRPVEAGTMVTVTWTPDGDEGSVIIGPESVEDDIILDGLGASCEVDNEGTCTFVVTSGGEAGSGTLAVTSIDGYSVDGKVRDDALAATGDALEGASGDKTWVDYDITVTADGVNPIGSSNEQDSEHTFRIEVDRTSGGGLDDITVDFEWIGDTGEIITIGGDALGTPVTAGSCMLTTGGTCDVIVDSDDAGSGTLVVTSLSDDSITDDNDAPVSITYNEGTELDEFECDRGNDEDDPLCAIKTWIDFAISVTPDSERNHTSLDHTFEVDLTSGDEALGDEFTIDDVEWEFSGTLADSDGTLADGVELVDDDTDCDGTGVQLPCAITVSSDGPGTLRLTVTSITVTGPDGSFTLDFGTGGSIDNDEDAEDHQADKEWIDYRISLEPPATNLVGDDHDFLVTAVRVTGEGVDDNEAANDVDLTICWDGDGEFDGVTADEDGCATFTTDIDGEVTVTITSPDAPGSGTLTVTAVTDDGEVDLPEAGVGFADLDFVDDIDEAEKTWRAFLVSITPDEATNLVDDDGDDLSTHVFDVEIYVSSDLHAIPSNEADQPNWQLLVLDEGQSVTIVANPSSADPDPSPQVTWSPTGDPYVSDTCSIVGTSGETDATCIITANSAVAGTWTIEAIGITLAGIIDGDEPVDLAKGDDAFATSGTVWMEGADPEWVDLDNTADKTWVGYGLKVTPDEAYNPLSEDPNDSSFEHTFTVTLRSDDPGTLEEGATPEYTPGAGPIAGEGVVIDLDLDSDVADVITINGEAVGAGFDPTDFTCSPVATLIGEDEEVVGLCEVTVSTSAPATGDWFDAAGTATLTASFEGQGDGQVTRTFEDSGVKYWSAIELVKTANPTLISAVSLPTNVTYTFDVTNHSPVPLSALTLTDTFFTDGGTPIVDLTDELSDTLDLGEDGDVLHPGESVTVTFIYSVPSGTSSPLTNVATVTGIDPGQNEISDSDDASVTITPPPSAPNTPQITLGKTADPTSLVLPEGEDATAVVTYTYTALNSGDVTLNNVTLTDDVLGDLTDELRAALGRSSMSVGESVTFSVDQTVDVDDVGLLVNIGTVSGTGGGRTVTDSDTATVEISQVLGQVFEPSIDIVKEAMIAPGADGLKTVTVPEDGGADITYRFTITNTGDTTLAGITLVDDVIGDLTSLLETTTLAPGDSTVLEVTYATTAADLVAGRVDNVGLTTGTSPQGATVQSSDDESVGIVEVLAEVEELPRSGANTTRLTALGLVLAALGSATLLLGAPRRRSHPL